MPSFNTFSGVELRALAAYLASLDERAAARTRTRGRDPAEKRAQEERLQQVWAAPKGSRYWSAVNNTEVGLWYTVATFVFFLGAGVLALMMRTQLAVPDNDFLSQEAYNQVFTMHGSVMMFLVAVPFLEAVAIYFLPQMLGARDLPFPRLSAYGFWCYIIGGTRSSAASSSSPGPTAAGSCTRRSPTTCSPPASAPTSGCSACRSSRSPRSRPRSS